MTTAPRLSIDLSALVANWQYLSSLSPKSETAAVVKANGYGIGIENVIPVLVEAGCHTFFVAMMEEGVRARRLAPEARIFVLNGIFADMVTTIVENRLTPVLSTLEQTELWATMGIGQPSAVQVDTGINRLGLTIRQVETLAHNRKLLKKLGVTTLMSHPACADDCQHELNRKQFFRFTAMTAFFDGLENSFANSAAILSAPETCYDLTRPGIAMYGGEAVNDMPNPMKTVVSANARIVQIRHAKKGESVGYGAAHILERDSRIAICSIGYADGYHRASSGRGVPLRRTRNSGGYGQLGNHKIPLIGRVSMDLTSFDITDVPEDDLKQTRWIEIFGPNILIDDAARAAGTIGYELLTGLGSRYVREYIR